ncbi:MAG: phospho-sugar mutase [Ruminococcaceae bacterium]|nr:phospho-sugar mutase [Oscillospiraceae bacterium]
MEYVENYNKWLGEPTLPAELRAELEGMSDDRKKFAFSGYMSFGTAGLRAEMGAGTAMMNACTVAHATEGIARLIEKVGGDAKQRGVVIAYDSRNNSAVFADRCAEVLTAHGIKVYLFSSLRPTPVLSFAILHLNCIAGLNITASHNPAEYNGYKAYWEDGAQLPPDHAATVSEEMAKIDIFADVPAPSAADRSLIIKCDELVDGAYIENVLSQRVNPEAIPSAADDLVVVYTPLHGAGATMVPEVLRKAGIKKLFTVDEQMAPNGDFPTVKYPNPEFAEAYTIGETIAEREGSDLIIATDPDADRVGAAVRGKDGKFFRITGNQMGALILDYVITALKETGGVPADAYAVKSIVSSELAARICEANGVVMHNVLTGFKFIGEVIKKHEAEGVGTFLLGFEESYGYLKGTYARDKDAVVASLLICEMAAYYKLRGMTLGDALEGLFKKYGFFRENVFSIEMKGLGADEKMKALMLGLRNDPPAEIAGRKITQIRDYKDGSIKNIVTGEITGTGLPSSNVLYYVTADRDVVVVRPSGTEPKVKVYIMTAGENAEVADKNAAEFTDAMKALLA